MTQEKAERLAREIASGNPHYFDLVKSLCNHILSGDHKREIENAAFRLAITECQEFAKEQRVHHGPYAYASNAALQCGHRICALITPANTDDARKAREAAR